MTEAEAGSSKGCSSVESRSSKVISALAPAADKDRGSMVVFIRSYLAIIKRERKGKGDQRSFSVSTLSFFAVFDAVVSHVE